MRLTLGLIRVVKRRVPTKDEDESPGSLEYIGRLLFTIRLEIDDGIYFFMDIDPRENKAYM